MSSERLGLSHETFTLILSRTIVWKGLTKLLNAKCQFTYTWDWAEKKGLATLDNIWGIPIGMRLLPVGHESGSKLEFMSTGKPIPFEWFSLFYIERIILDVSSPDRKAVMMLSDELSVGGSNGIIATENWTWNNHEDRPREIALEGSRVGTSGGKFTLTLDKVLRGTSDVIIKKLVGEYSYVYNWVTNMGSATLETIDGTAVNFYMFPMGIEGRLAFMARLEPGTKVTLPDGSTIIIYRALFDLIGNEASAAFMLGEEGDEILVTQNWEATEEETVAISKRVVKATYSS